MGHLLSSRRPLLSEHVGHSDYAGSSRRTRLYAGPLNTSRVLSVYLRPQNNRALLLVDNWVTAFARLEQVFETSLSRALMDICSRQEAALFQLVAVVLAHSSGQALR